jgi:hypothetical protein
MTTILTADYATYTAKGYTLNTNPWGKGSLVNGVDYTQSISFDPTTFPNGIDFSWSWPTYSTGAIYAYPEIKYVPPAPAQIANLTDLSVTYSTTMTGNPNNYDVALDLWLTTTPYGTPGSTVQDELMIFFHNPPQWDFVAGQWAGNQPYTITAPGLNNAHVNIEPNHGATSTSPGWTLISVENPTDVLSGTLSISDVIKTLIKEGVLSGHEYLSDVQLGAEIAGGTGGLNINNLSYNWNANQSLVGTAGNDTFVITSMGGNDIIGNGGIDTVVYSDSYSNYQIKSSGSEILITEGNNIATLDMLQGIAFIQFSDGTYNIATASITASITPNAPVISSFLPDSGVVGDGITNATTLILTGTAVANSTVAVFDGTTQLGTATVNASGAWSFTTGMLANGTHSFTATDTEVGNTSAASAALAVTVDTTAPTVSSVVAAGAGITNGTGDLNAGHVVTLTGNLNEAVTVAGGTPTLTLNDGGTATYTGGSGTNALTFSYTVAAGQNTADLAVTAVNLNSATVTDAAGNAAVRTAAVTTPAGTLQIDTTAPAAPVISSDSPANGNAITLTGTAEVNSTVTVFDGATKLGTATANASGAWSYTTAALSNGAHSFTATAMDAAGNISLASQPVDPIIDTTAPVAPAITAFSPDSGTVGDGITNATVLTLTGTAEANSTAAVFDGSTKLGTATANGSGAWSYTTGTLASTSHSFTATATDAAGNTGAASSALSVTIDTTAPVAPTITAFSPDSGVMGDHITNATVLTLTGTAEANSTVAVFDGSTKLGTATANGSGAWSFTTGTLASTSHSFTATDTDAAGNTGAASSALSVTIDTTAPVAPTITAFSPDSGVMGDHITNATVLTLTGTAEANSTVKVYDGTTQLSTATVNASGAWSFTTGGLSNGTHSFTATDTDAAGKTSVASAALAVTVDTVAPNAPVIASDATVNTNEVNLTGMAEANSTVTVYDGTHTHTTKLGTATANASGAWSFTTGTLANGAHSFTARDTDAAGNTSLASQPIDPTIDPAAPPSIVAFSPDSGTVGDGITNANKLTLTGTAVANSTVNIYDGSTLLGTAASNGSGAWSFATAMLVIGSHSFTATDTVSGATSAASAALAVIVDTVAPAVTDHLASDTGSSSTDKITSIDTLTGSGDPNAVVHFTVDGTPIAGTATANSSGVWTFAPTGLADGHHTIVASETYAAGNTGTASLTFTLDTKAPVVTESLAKDTGSSSTDKITSIDTLTGSGDPNAVVHFTVDGNLIEDHTATANSSGIWTFTPWGLANGTHTIVTSETDAAGNTGTASLTFTFDMTAPTTTIADIVQKTANNVSTTTISGTSEAGSLVTLYEGNHVLDTATVANTGQWSISLNSLSNTVHNFTAAATDLAGNNGTHSQVAIFGSTGSDKIVGVAAGDIIVSSGGADKLTAGSGNDTFIFNPGFGKDTVSKFDLNHDVVAFDHTLFASVANVLSHAQNINGNAVITFDSGDTVTLVGIKTAQLLAHQNDIHII